MSLFGSPFRATSTDIEAKVLSVDADRYTCEVLTARGQSMRGVRWLGPVGGSSRGGMTVTPLIGDSVYISTALGYPLIIGSIPSVSNTEITNPMTITSVETNSDTGNRSGIFKGSTANPNKPADTVHGDHILASEGGGLLALLANGTAIIKSSAMAQIFVSKMDEVVRLVGRNFEVFTDLFTDVTVSMSGKLYRYIGYGSSLSDARNERYAYEEFYGNVGAAQSYKQNYYSAAGVTSADPNPEGLPADSGGTIRKIQVAGGYFETLGLGGTWTQACTAGGRTVQYQSGSTWQVTSSSGTVGKVSVSPGSVVIDWNSGNTTVKLDGSGLTVTTQAKVQMTSSGDIDLNAGGSMVLAAGGGVTITAGGGLNMSGGGVSMSASGGQLNIS